MTFTLTPHQIKCFSIAILTMQVYVAEEKVKLAQLEHEAIDRVYYKVQEKYFRVKMDTEKGKVVKKRSIKLTKGEVQLFTRLMAEVKIAEQEIEFPILEIFLLLDRANAQMA